MVPAPKTPIFCMFRFLLLLGREPYQDCQRGAIQAQKAQGIQQDAILERLLGKVSAQ
jgi:hypothetical protein